MSVEKHASTAHWAILIGINHYPGKISKRLGGAVRDVETIKEYLGGLPVSINMVILTSTSPHHACSFPPGETPVCSCPPLEEPDSRPTSSNFDAALERVFQRAKPGDFVYIHYSGHGTILPNSLRKPGQATQEELASGQVHKRDLSLVLLHETGCKPECLESKNLAGSMNRMVEKGLLITLVLDCCFSGGITRHGDIHAGDVRYLDYDPAFATASAWENKDAPDPGRGLRDSKFAGDWIIKNPHGYTVLCAASPHEKAWELTIRRTGEKRGALTFFLLSALHELRQGGLEVTHQSLYEYLRHKFHAQCPRQTPIRYGHQHLSFFGKVLDAATEVFVSVYHGETGLRLDQGEIHGVCEGDEYAVFSFESPACDLLQCTAGSSRVRVEAVGSLTSELSRLELASAMEIKSGDKAVLATSVRHPRANDVAVRLMLDDTHQVKCERALTSRRFLHLLDKNNATETAMFSVTLNGQQEYEIHDGNNDKVETLPTIPAEVGDGSTCLMDVLEHVATLKYFEGLRNLKPTPAFERKLEFATKPEAGESGVCDVKHGGLWELRVRNSSDNRLFLTIFNLTASWGIKNVLLGSGGSYFIPVPSNETSGPLRFKMELPEVLRTRLRQGEDIIKVFVTGRPTSFPSVIQSDISLSGKQSRGNSRSRSDTISHFISELEMGFRSNGNILSEEWTCRNFIIRTTFIRSKWESKAGLYANCWRAMDDNMHGMNLFRGLALLLLRVVFSASEKWSSHTESPLFIWEKGCGLHSLVAWHMTQWLPAIDQRFRQCLCSVLGTNTAPKAVPSLPYKRAF